LIKKILHNKLFKDSFVYVFADVINKAIPFLLLPVLTYYLSPEDYGLLGIFNSFVAVMLILVGFSVQGAISVNYYKYSKEKLAVYIGNAVYVLLTTFLVLLTIVTLLKNYLYNKLELPYFWMLIAIAMAFTSYFVLINLSLWIVEQKPESYGMLQVADTLIKLLLSLYFVIILGMSWQGNAWGMFLGSLLLGVLSVYLLFKRGYLKFEYNKKDIKDILHFGTPLIPHQLSFWLRSGAVVFILMYLVGKKETGLYNVAYQLILPVLVLSTAFNKAWAPYLYRKLSSSPNENDKQKIVKFTYVYFIGILLLALIIVQIAPYMIRWLLAKDFSDSAVYIKYLSFGAAFHGMYFMVVNYIFYEKKNKYLAVITFFTSIFNVILAYYLIDNVGAIGAAQAYMATSFLSFILVWYYSNKVYKMPWKRFV